MNKKIAIILLAMCIMLLACGVVACKDDQPLPIPPCQTHIDRDVNGICDICSATVQIVPPCNEHVDADLNGKCDVCSSAVVVIVPCEDLHFDANVNGECDACHLNLTNLATTVQTTQQTLVLSKSQLAITDYSAYFSVTVNNTPLKVTASMLNLEEVPTDIGTGKVTLTYNGVSATLQIEVKNFVRYTVESTTETVDIVDEQLSEYDFTALFVAKADGAIVLVTEDMISFDQNLQNGQSGSVICNYQGKQAQVKVNVIPTIYDLQLAVDSVEINYKQVSEVNFAQYFVATRNGEKQPITEDMVSSNVGTTVGTYSYTVTFHGVTKTLVVVLNDKHDVQIVKAYPNGYNLQQNLISSFDVKNLFYLYVDGVAVQVTDQMLSGTIQNTNVGDTNTITCTHTVGDTTQTVSVVVTIVQQILPTITSQNIQIYPTQSDFDLTTLFSIDDNGQNVPVTLDMLTVPDDILSEGVHVVTLTYKGQTANATVTVIRGVTIENPRGTSITVAVGTNIYDYDFSKDFSVTINGMTFPNLNDYIDLSQVDFSKEGTSQATLNVDYDGNVYTSVVTYTAVKSQCKISILQDHVVLTTTNGYDVFSNLKIIAQFAWGEGEVKLTSNPNHAAINTYYATHTPIDYNSIAVQQVTVSVYINGQNSAPVQVSFTLQISATVVVTPVERVIFAGETVHPSDLFNVTVDGKQVQIDLDDVTGKIDCFTPGVYTLTLNYQGYVVNSRAVVYDAGMKGTYKTLLSTIATESAEDDEGYTTQDSTESRFYGDLVFGADGNITVDGRKVNILYSIDINTMMVEIGKNEYVMYYNDGIIVLNPDNKLRMQFSNDKRPLVYFNEDIWQIQQLVTINYSPTYYVLQTEYNQTYSIDTFHIKRTTSDQTKWYGLKVHLTSRTTSGTTYEVNWGEVVYADNFEAVLGNESSLTFNGEFYPFTMNGNKNGTINRDVVDTSAYGSYTGTVDGKQATLVVNSYYSLTVGGERWAYLTDSNLVNEHVYVGLDSDSGIFTIYNHVNLDQGAKFFGLQLQLDFATKTFTQLAQTDGLQGLYLVDDVMLFLDGYGRGMVNYDVKSYYDYQIAYSVVGNTMTLTHLEYNELFPYGKTATFTLSELGNTLKVKDFQGLNLVGKTLVNQYVKSGAIVTVEDATIFCSTAEEGKNALYNKFNVVTTDGALTLEDKKAVAWSSWGTKTYCFDTSTINFTQDGFYQFSINLTLDGQKVTTYYSVQIVRPKQTAVSYGRGIVNPDYSFAIDQFGIAVLSVNGVNYRGQVKTDTNDNLVAHLSNGNSHVMVKSRPFADGILEIVASGDVTFNEFFTTGTVSQMGTSGALLRKVVIGANTIYLFSDGVGTSSVDIVQVNLVSGSSVSAIGSILEIVNGDKKVYVKVASWGDDQSGLVLADIFRGTHQNQNLGTLVVDGFGNATLTKDGSTKSGIYKINSAKEIMLQFSNDFCVYTIDNGTFEEYNITLNNSLLQDKTYVFTGVGTADDTMDSAYYYNVKFAFDKGGVVTITSELDANLNDEDVNVNYLPKFVGTGSYTVKGDVVTVTIGEHKFTFVIDKVIYATKLTCTSTTLTEDDQGYFKINAIFSKI